MALRVHYTSAVGVDTLLTTVRLGSISGLTTNANQGTVGGGTLEVPDKGGLITPIRGLKRMNVNDDASPVGSSMLFNGYNGPRTLDRGEFLTGTDRWWHCTLVDTNSLLTTLIIHEIAGTPPTTGIRPAETDVERVNWLMESGYLYLVQDLGLISSASPVNMSAADYTLQTAADVLRDCGLQAQKQWFVYYDETAGADGLFYDKASSDVFNSTHSFSNVEGEWGDIDDSATVCFQVMSEPSPGIEFDPSRVLSELAEPFQGSGSPAYRKRAATAAEFYPRAGVAPSANVKTLALANERADRMLEAISTEAKVVTFRAKLPRAKAGLIMAGHRFLAHFEHLNDQLGGAAGFVAFRVLSLNFAHDTTDQRYYNIGIRADPLPPVALEQYGTQVGLSDVHFIWPIAAPGAGNLLVSGIMERDNYPPGDPSSLTTAPYSFSGPWGGGDSAVVGTDFVLIDGLLTQTDGPDTYGNPIAMYYRDSTVDDTLWVSQEGGGSDRPRAYFMEIGGLSGAPAVEVGLGNIACDRTNTVYTSPNITTTGAGYIIAIFGYSCTGPEGRPPMSFAPRSGHTLEQGYCQADFGPYSWFGYRYVNAAGTYNLILDRSMGSPGYPRVGWRYGWILSFWAGSESVGYPA